MDQLWFQKLFWNQDCYVVSNLLVEIAIYDFDLFHSTLLGIVICSTMIKRNNLEISQKKPDDEAELFADKS